MKKLVLVLAIVFAFGVTYALNMEAPTQTQATEQVSNADEKEKKKDAKACSKKKKDAKECSKKKKCSSKKSCS